VITTLQARDPDGGALGPVFPDTLGGWRDPSNTRRALRGARGSDGFAWVTSHVFRRTCATILDQSGLSPRAVADQLGHAQVSMTQNFYLGRRIANPGAAAALDAWHDQGGRPVLVAGLAPVEAPSGGEWVPSDSSTALPRGPPLKIIQTVSSHALNQRVRSVQLDRLLVLGRLVLERPHPARDRL
jgi:hypothetical protein